MDNFNEKVIWIIGASSGLGEAIAYEFDKLGAKLILSARNEVDLQRVQSKTKKAVVLTLDLDKIEQLEEKVKEAIAFFGEIDLVVHCGGVAQNATAMETTYQTELKIFNTNFFGSTEINRHLLPHFISRNSGQIVLISGVLGMVAMPGRSSYGASKAALHAYYGSMRAELAGKNIDITILIPGLMNTALTQKALGASGEIAGKKAEGSGAPVEKVAKQALKAIRRKKYQQYVGNADQGKIMLFLNRLFPSLVTKLILKRTAKAMQAAKPS